MTQMLSENAGSNYFRWKVQWPVWKCFLSSNTSATVNRFKNSFAIVIIFRSERTRRLSSVFLKTNSTTGSDFSVKMHLFWIACNDAHFKKVETSFFQGPINNAVTCMFFFNSNSKNNCMSLEYEIKPENAEETHTDKNKSQVNQNLLAVTRKKQLCAHKTEWKVDVKAVLNLKSFKCMWPGRRAELGNKSSLFFSYSCSQGAALKTSI